MKRLIVINPNSNATITRAMAAAVEDRQSPQCRIDTEMLPEGPFGIESDADIAAKAEAAWRAGCIAVICCGETLDEREAGQTLDIVGGQLAVSIPDGATAANTVVAYEPVWAIGTGKVPTLEQIGEVHDDIRSRLTARFGDEGDGMRVLYGGSVKPGNAAEIFAVSNVDGALVGGASLKAEDFGGIIAALAES